MLHWQGQGALSTEFVCLGRSWGCWQGHGEMVMEVLVVLPLP